MLNICSLFQKFFGFIKNIQKTTYRKCMVIVSGIVLVSVICLAASDFGGSGKSSVSNSREKGIDETDTDTNDTDANAIIQDLLFSYGSTSDEDNSNIKGFYNSLSEILSDKEKVLLNNKHATVIPVETDKLALSGKDLYGQNNSETESVSDMPVETEGTTTDTSSETVKDEVVEETVEETVKETVEETIEEATEETAASYNGVCFEVTDSDYYWLTKIVEAEAGDQDEIGKILVANVIINRVNSDRFPDNIKSVIFQNNGITYQFEPVKNERIYDMNPTDNTISCVDRALNGEDYSQGALFFTMRTSSGSWFNSSLTLLFVHGDHYFYIY